MRPGEALTLCAFLFFVVLGAVRQIPPRQQRESVALTLLGTALIAATHLLSLRSPVTSQIVGDWLPCILMLLVYWQSGCFVSAPNQKLQAWLYSFDQRQIGTLLKDWAEHRNSTWLGHYFELAYLMCYTLVPLGIGMLYWAQLRNAIDGYWATLLPPTYLCYLLVPFTQTLPPRLLSCAGDPPPGRHKIRALNLFILRHASIHLNTFPSAHVACTFGASLVLLKYVPWVGAAFLLISLSIAIGAVVGRYHYALDVIIGALLPVCVRCLLGN